MPLYCGIVGWGLAGGRSPNSPFCLLWGLFCGGVGEGDARMQERGCAARELLDGPIAPVPSLWGRGTPRCASWHRGLPALAVPWATRALACSVGRCREPPSELLPWSFTAWANQLPSRKVPKSHHKTRLAAAVALARPWANLTLCRHGAGAIFCRDGG